MAKKISDEQINVTIAVNGNKGQKALADLEAKNRKLSESTEDLRKAKQLLIAEGKKESEEYRKITQQLKANSSEVKSNKSKMADLRKEIGISALTTKQLRQEQKRLKIILSNTTPDTATYKRYEQELKAVNDRIKDLSKNSKETGSILGKMKSSLSGISGLIAGAFSVGAVIKFGTTVINSVKELGKVKSTLQQITGLKGLALKSAAAGIKGLSDAYDKDTSEMSEAVHNFAQGMEIDFNQALSLVKDGFLEGADANGEFLDKLREYPALLSEAGFSAEQAISLMTQEIKSGIYSDKGVDTIKEANLRLREMPKSTKEALEAIGISSDAVQESLKNGSQTTFDIMKLVSTKLSELPPQSAEVGQAIADIFGGPGEDAGYKYLANLQNINLETSSLTSTSNDYLEAKKLEIKANEALNLVWLKLTGTGSGLNNFYNRLKLGIAETLGGEKSLTEELHAQADKVINLNNELSPLITEYDALKSKSELSKDEQARLKVVIGQIAKITPTAITAFDEYGNALDINSAKAKDFIETQKALLVFRNKEAIDENKEAIEEYSQIIGRLQSQLSRRNEAGDIVGLDGLRLSGEKIAKLQSDLANFQGLVTGAKADLDQISGSYLDKEVARQKKQTEVELFELQKRAEALKINIENKTASELKAAISAASKTDLGGGITEEDKKAYEEKHKALQSYEDQKRSIIENSELLQAKSDADFNILKIKQAADAKEKEINDLKISDEKKRELLSLSFEEESMLIDEQIALKAEKELETQQALAEAKRELEQQQYDLDQELLLERDLLEAETQLEKDAVKLEHDYNLSQQRLQIERDFALEKLEIEGATDSQIQALRKKFITQEQLLSLKHEKDKRKLAKDTADYKANKLNDELSAASSATGQLADLLGKQTKAGKVAAIAQATINTWQGVTQVWRAPSTLPEPAGTISKVVSTATVLASGLKAVGAIKATSAEGFEDGLYPVIRKQDGKRYNAGINSSQTQIANNPTILVGERPELIVDPDTFKKMDPQVVDYIMRLSGTSVPGFENGLSPSFVPSANEEVSEQVDSVNGINVSDTQVMVKLTEAINKLTSEGVRAFINYGISDELDRQEIEDKITATKLASKN